MKVFIILLICVFLIISVFGQNNISKCYVLRVANKEYLKDTSLLQPKLYLQGFYVVSNGVYDLKINDKMYYYQRVFEIKKDSIYTGYVFDTTPTLKFSINDNICIYLWQCSDGRCGFPLYTKRNNHKYEYKIIETEKYCSLDSLKIVLDKTSSIEYPGFQYLAGSGFLVIYKKDGGDFVFDGTLARNIYKQKQ